MHYENNIYFDKTTKVYRYSKSGKKLSKKALFTTHSKAIKQFNDSTKKLVDGLAAKQISFLDFQKTIVRDLKDLKLFSLELAKGNKSNTFAIDYLTQARQLKNHDYPGLKRLFIEISNGDHSEKMIKARLRSFGFSSRQAFEDGLQSIAEESNKSHMVRYLTGSNHCEECILYASQGVKRIGELPLPTEQCSCSYNCKCVVLYGTLAELINR